MPLAGRRNFLSTKSADKLQIFCMNIHHMQSNLGAEEDTHGRPEHARTAVWSDLYYIAHTFPLDRVAG